MRKNIIIFFSLCVVFHFTACKTDQQNKTKPEVAPTSIVPALPEAELRKLVFNCTGVEYIFKELPISLSFTRDQGLETNLFFASGKLPSYDTKNCKSLARKIYSIGTEIYLEAEVFFDGRCHHYDFYQNGKLIYRSDMSEQGIYFYNNVLKQAQQAQSGQPINTQ